MLDTFKLVLITDDILNYVNTVQGDHGHCSLNLHYFPQTSTDGGVYVRT